MARSYALLARMAYNMRVSSLRATTAAGSGHPTSCLSAADIMAALFFDAMRYNPRDYEAPDNDRFVLSKGHASILLYAAWKEAGLLSEQELMTYRAIDSNLEGHPTARFPYCEAATGSLGMGLSIGAGIALNARLDAALYRTYVMLGDSELAEGSVWEAAEIAAFYKLDHLIAIVDCNRLGQSTETLYGHNIERYAALFSAFGWRTLIVDGHDYAQLTESFEQAAVPEGKPTVILAKTFKGYGVKRLEDQEGFHGKAVKPEELEADIGQMTKRFADAMSENGQGWSPKMPEQHARTMTCNTSSITMPESIYELGQKIATRKVYGQALALLGRECETIVSLDAEVKNSTFAEIFEQEHPARFFQCFIAEQNMVSMGVGLARRGKIPFISTFGAFFSRAHDQVRMAAIGQSPVRLVGSHVGVSIGQDGPSQMALEDLGIMRALPESIVLYPSDAVSTHRLIEHMARYEKGVSYMRTTRMATPVLYNNSEQFPLGQCKVLRESSADRVCVVAAGVTLHEALKAQESLQKDGTAIRVIDLYCVKPLPTEQLIEHGKAAGGTVLVVEDHYPEGGIGEAVAAALSGTSIQVSRLAVNTLPRSGQPEELLAYMGIDAKAIVERVALLR